MQVRQIETMAEFESLRSDWNAAFAADPCASVFMSWDWLRGWLEIAPDDWCVLAARESMFSRWIGFLPLIQRGSRHALRFDQVRELRMAGEPAADYTGFVCPAGAQRRVLHALANHLATELAWDKLRFEEVRDPRLPEFLDGLPVGINVLDHQGTGCPRMALPATWEQYLRGLSSATRQSLRRRLREAEGRFIVQRSDAGGPAHLMVDALIDMAEHRTREHPDPHTWRLAAPLKRCADAGLAKLLTLRHDGEPAACVAMLLDAKDRSCGVWVTSFNERFAEFSPGRVAVALAIRDAIAEGWTWFDFMRGQESYKFQFGASNVHSRTVMMQRSTLQATLRRGLHGVREALHI